MKNEQKTLNGRRGNSNERINLFRCWLPYGLWTCPDNRSVLFNRYYEPIWERTNSTTTKSTNHSENIPWTTQIHFYLDINQPWRHPSSLINCLLVLKQFNATYEPLTHYSSIKQAELRISKSEGKQIKVAFRVSKPGETK
jgi:hypothetical protein